MDSKIVEITEGRDAGKVFRVEEMPVSKLEKWAARALTVLCAGGGNVSPHVLELAKTSNTAALLEVFRAGLAGLTWEQAEPLYDALLPYIWVLPGGSEQGAIQLKPGNIDAHIRDVLTIVKLRGTVLELSLGFSFGG